MKNFFLFVLLFSIISIQSFASEVRLKMPNGLIANAAYIKGNTDKPTVFLLHGFLQTHNFSTITRLFDNISSEGYTVFSPTLTLGIPERKESLACEALHDHTMEHEYDEIYSWLKWLKKKGHKKIVLIGHSQGSVSLLNYLTKTKSTEVKKFIAVSIVEVNMSKNILDNKRLIKELKQKLVQNIRQPSVSKFSFCIKYLGTPRSFLSYQNWTTNKIVKELRNLKQPVTIIMGGSDVHVRKNWIEKIKGTGKSVTVVQGANHFMDGFNEFDLFEIVLNELII